MTFLDTFKMVHVSAPRAIARKVLFQIKIRLLISMEHEFLYIIR